MRLAILGTRGIPANYGGFETFAEELSVRLVARGHAVTVYCRSNNVEFRQPFYRGVRLFILPTIGTKHLDTVVHTFFSVLHAVPHRFDAVLICNAANAIFAAIPRLTGSPVALNVDGIERRRKKWGTVARAYYRLSEWLATFVPNAIVTDAHVIERYYLQQYRKHSVMIAYGADCHAETTVALDTIGLEPRGYFLYVSRLEPENNAHRVIAAYAKVPEAVAPMPLAIVGDAPHAKTYIEALKQTRDSRVRFPGAIYGMGYKELQSHALAYIHATEVGGTHPALIEAMAAGNCVLVMDTPENREVAGDAGLFFKDEESLADLFRLVLSDPERVGQLRVAARQRAQERYSWDAVTDQYEALFEKLVGQAGPSR